MKRNYILLSFVLYLVVAGCSSQSGDQPEQKVSGQVNTLGGTAEIEFSSNVKDLGAISAGEQIVTYFRYENTGDGPLLIADIKAGCGCTVPRWNDEPLKPGAADDIKVVFNSTGKQGNQNIKITVNSNARNSSVPLVIKAIVTEDK